MWLLNASTLRLESFHDDDVPQYAILSHRWEDDEVTFKAVRKGAAASLKGWYKIQKCCDQALSNGLAYAWVDTCCIDKRSSAELSEAINSMYQWYENSAVCYVYLSDLNHSESVGSTPGLEMFTQSVWFTRGWTLQELLAPLKLEFFNARWHTIGSKTQHVSKIAARTGIPSEALHHFVRSDYSVRDKMLWASNRTTTRIEDRAYSLLGLFDLNIPLLYGEGHKAFFRFQEELLRVSADTSILLFSGAASEASGLLAVSPESFGFDAKNFIGQRRAPQYYDQDFNMTKQGISATFDLVHFALDVYAARLGSAQHHLSGWKSPFIFVRWNYWTKRYERVRLDGQNFIMALAQPENETHIGQKTIEIGNTPLVSASSTRLTRTRLDQYLIFSPGASEILTKKAFLLAGKYSRHPKLQVSMGAEARFMSRIYKQDTHPRDKPTTNTLSHECICFGDTIISRKGEPINSSQIIPTAALHLARNLTYKPVLLLSLITDPIVPLYLHASVQERKCNEDGHLWFWRRLYDIESSMDLVEQPSSGIEVSATGTDARLKLTVQDTAVYVGDLLTVLLSEDAQLDEVYGDVMLPDNWSNGRVVNYLPQSWLAPSEASTISNGTK